jgi:DNA-binding transcriptional MerR regulator
MKTYTVAELARLAGISVRTLHHYDEIGLLKPAFTGQNRYRYYGRDELLRLQQILIHRELDIPLGEIGALLDRPGKDRLSTLIEQREKLEAQAKHFAGLVETIDRTIAGLKGEAAMDDNELYRGVVSPQKHAEYERWLEGRFGEGIRDHIETRRAAWQKLSKDDAAAMMAELKAVEQGLAEGMQLGLKPNAPELAPLLERHRKWVQLGWGDKEVTAKAYLGLADIYISHPDFVARYESIASGFAEFLHHAMLAEARRLQG